MKTIKYYAILAILATGISASPIRPRCVNPPAQIERIEPAEAIDTLIERYQMKVNVCMIYAAMAPNDQRWQDYCRGRADAYKETIRDLLTLRQLIKQESK